MGKREGWMNKLIDGQFNMDCYIAGGDVAIKYLPDGDKHAAMFAKLHDNDFDVQEARLRAMRVLSEAKLLEGVEKAVPDAAMFRIRMETAGNIPAAAMADAHYSGEAPMHPNVLQACVEAVSGVAIGLLNPDGSITAQARLKAGKGAQATAAK